MYTQSIRQPKKGHCELEKIVYINPSKNILSSPKAMEYIYYVYYDDQFSFKQTNKKWTKRESKEIQFCSLILKN